MASEAHAEAQAEELTLLVSANKTGFFGVYLSNYPGNPKPHQARVWRGGKDVSLGSFVTAEEAALRVARSPEGRAAAAARAAAPAPLTSEEARRQAQAEGLTLRVAESKTGYFGVTLDKPGRPRPFKAQLRRGGKQVSMGHFATAEEAALCFARSPEGRAAAGRAAAAESQGTLPAVPSGAIPREKGMTPAIAPGAVVKVEDLLQLLDDDDLEAALPSGASLKEEDTAPPMPPGTFVKEEGTVPPMPPDACVKVEVVVKEEEGSDGRPHTQRQRVK